MSRCQVSFKEPEATPQAAARSSPKGSNGDDYFAGDRGRASPSPARSLQRRASLCIKIPPPRAAADMALTALQYLPHPIMVLSSSKEVILANEAMGRLLGIEDLEDEQESGEDESSNIKSVTDILYGATFSQLGFDVLQGGNPVFVAWDDFLESLVDDASRTQCSTTSLNTYHRGNVGNGSASASASERHQRSASEASNGSRHHKGSKTEVHDALVDVVFSTSRDNKTGLPLGTRHDLASHVQAQMIVSVWASDDDFYFTLTFTASSQASNTTYDSFKTTSRTVSRHSNSLRSGPPSESSSTSSQNKSNRTSTTPTTVTSRVTSPRLLESIPGGPPGKSLATAPRIFSKTNRLKDAILNTLNLPAYAMWKDGTFGVPNKAAIRLVYPWIENGEYDSNEQARDFLSKFVLWDEDFTSEIPQEDFPISRVLRERKGFDGYRVGMYSPKDGSRLLFDASGEPITDDQGEFLGGLAIFKDVTLFQNTIDKQQKDNDMQFERLCNMVPVMVWRATSEGMVDYLSDRWMSYTGTTVDENIGSGWVNAVHPEDITVAAPIWKKSVETGCEYLTEYRLRRSDGAWRWMLARAIPVRDGDATIAHWFGTCTDIDDLVRTREEAKQTHAQLERVIEHAHITLWAVDKQKRMILFEGKPMWDPEASKFHRRREQYVGMHIYDILKNQGRGDETETIEQPIADILAGKKDCVTFEVQVKQNGRWFKTRLFPLLRQQRKGGLEGESFVDGVVGIAMDITEWKKAAKEVEQKNLENSRLMAQSVAASEASKMKSQFLANMSHEIRTPIAGVIGMSELLLEDKTGELTEDQRDCATNIQRSANALLTVINDILDFSKVESGRLDIEEVQFDLSAVIRDVNKMLSFAAERKGLKYIDDIQEMRSWKVMGDPGRLRQVMTNLLTNSIKFTTEGSVTLRAMVQNETPDILGVRFTVEDTGIGIEDDVRKKLFQPFSQGDSSTHRRFGGTGLGLTISKNLVELMRGEISLQSKLGQGTIATFFIPFHKAPYQSTDSPTESAVPIPDRLQADLSISKPSSDHSGRSTPTTPAKFGHVRGASATSGLNPTSDEGADGSVSEVNRENINVLVVEDNAVNQQIAIKTITRLGFPVKAVWNGQEALDYLKNPKPDNPRPDIILMDVQMPVMDGYHATHTIRHSFPNSPQLRDTPIVAMTASAIQGDREKCESAGMDDYLSKPVKKPALENMLLKWAVEGRRRRADLVKGPAKPKARPAGSRNPSSFDFAAVSHGGDDQLSSKLTRLDFAHRTAVERSAETTSETAQRQQQQEEKAISLRDDVLLESGVDPKTRLGRNLSDEADQHKSYAPESSALTTENMRMFVEKSRVASLKSETSGLTDDTSSMKATMGDSPGDSTSVGRIDS